jgi:hypothetical protein
MLIGENQQVYNHLALRLYKWQYYFPFLYLEAYKLHLRNMNISEAAHENAAIKISIGQLLCHCI